MRTEGAVRGDATEASDERDTHCDTNNLFAGETQRLIDSATVNTTQSH